ncbi:MAG: response regulator, partial [Mariprofundaceae bacterium]|nr:response regulator [Mariprofundaceae bacterium]
MKALIVDDDQGIRWILERVLKEEGFEVAQAESIAQAEALAKERFDILFLDVYLPDGNGMSLLESGLFDVPTVMLTAETTFGHAAEAYRSGAMEYLPKPFDLNEVRQLANRVVPQKPKSAKAVPVNTDTVII